MAVTADQPAPYAPASAILDVVTRHRTRGLPGAVDQDSLERAGISPSLVPRTLHALRTLDLITEDGRPSDVLEGIRLAPEAEYQQRLLEWLQGAYADALQFIDPSTDGEDAIRDAFRKYVPIGQQPRMVSLFSGLFAAAGVGVERPKQPAKKVAPSAAPRPRAAQKVAPKPDSQARQTGIPAALSGLLLDIPDPATGWTQDKRDKFMSAFGVLLDYSIPIVATPAPTITATDQ